MLLLLSLFVYGDFISPPPSKFRLYDVCCTTTIVATLLYKQEVREAAKRARDIAKTELQHHEETLVASTRETDRLLSDYK